MTVDGLEIRTARRHEYELLGRLTFAGFGHAEPGARQPTPERRRLLLDAAARAESGDLLVAADAVGNVVGTASLLRPGTALTRQSTNGEAELRLLAVLPSERRLGAGLALMEEALARAAAWGAPALILDTGPSNFRSQRLYHRLGFDRLPHRETQPSTSGPPLAVFRYPFDNPNGIAARLAGGTARAQALELLDAHELWAAPVQPLPLVGPVQIGGPVQATAAWHGPAPMGWADGYDLWRFETRGTGRLLAAVAARPIRPPHERGPVGPDRADVLAPVAAPVAFTAGSDSEELRGKVREHLDVLIHGGLVT